MIPSINKKRALTDFVNTLEALLKLNTLFHEEMALPCSELISSDVLFRLARKDRDGRGIRVLYEKGVLRPLIYGDCTLKRIAGLIKEDCTGHRLGTKPNLLSNGRRRKPRQDGYELVLEHGNYLNEFSKPIAIEGDMFREYRKYLKLGADSILKRGLENPLTQRDAIAVGDPDICGFVKWLSSVENVTQTDVLKAANDNKFGTKGFDMIALSFAARCRAFNDMTDSVQLSREIPSKMVPHWGVFENERAEESEVSVTEESFPVPVRLRPLLNMPFDELVGVREQTSMKEVRKSLRLYLDSGGDCSHIETICSQLNEALSNIKLEGRKLSEALTEQDGFMKIRAFLVRDVPKSLEITMERATDAVSTQIPLLGTVLKGVRFVASLALRGRTETWREADSYTFSYYPISGQLKVKK